MKIIGMVAALAMSGSAANAQTPVGSASSALSAPPGASAPTAPVSGAKLATGTPVIISIGQLLSSNSSKTGDKFPIALATPIVVDGQVVAPAGATGMGEVVYADPAGGGGTPGKLVLAARYVDVGDIRIKLKAFNLSAGGDVDFRTMQMAASILSVGVFLIPGGEVRYPLGTRAGAKVAEDVVLPVTLPAATAPQPASAVTPSTVTPVTAPTAGVPAASPSANSTQDQTK